MFRPFQQVLTTTTYTSLIVVQDLRTGRLASRDARPCGDPRDPVPFNVIVEGAARDQGGSYSGAHIRASYGIGPLLPRQVFIDDEPKRLSGRGLNLMLEGRLEAAGETVLVTGGVAWDPDAGTELSGATVTNLQSRTDIEADIAAITSLGAMQRDAVSVHAHANALTGGSSMIPIQILLYGRRFVGQTWTRLGGMVVGAGTGNATILAVEPGEFDALGYRVRGFGSVGDGSCTLFMQEEVGGE